MLHTLAAESSQREVWWLYVAQSALQPLKQGT
jgi:hypothetical protein